MHDTFLSPDYIICRELKMENSEEKNLFCFCLHNGIDYTFLGDQVINVKEL